ncbi:hypothetical protein FACS1894109_14020 [Spirochaetia bacterium]|nr:hypothetical protein FACS1894109_14020 [Spirochaetia bacterium]
MKRYRMLLAGLAMLVLLGATVLTGCDLLNEPETTTTTPDPDPEPVPELSSDKNITVFNFASPAATGIISGTAIVATVPYGTDVTGLTPTVTHTGASINPEGAQNFTSPVNYTVTAEDESTQTYTVTVVVASNNAKDITGFSFFSPAATGIISGTDIAVNVPFGTDKVHLTPTVTHTGASISPATATEQDFTNPVTYTVTAADNSTKAYTVTVTVLDQPSTVTIAPIVPQGAPTFSGVIIGGQQVFEVTSTAGSIVWSVKGSWDNKATWTTEGLRPDTNITSETTTSGRLRISNEETAGYLRITATLADNSTISGYLDAKMLSASETPMSLAALVLPFTDGKGITVSETSVTIPTATSLTVPFGETLTIPIGATLKIEKNDSLTDDTRTINGTIRVLGTLDVADKTIAQGTGTGEIIVQSNGTFIDGNKDDTDGNKRFKFLATGKQVTVEGGGVLWTDPAAWGDATGTPEIFIGTDSALGIIRLPPDGTVTLKVNDTTTNNLDIDLDGYVVVRGLWKPNGKDIITVKKGGTLNVESAGYILLKAQSSTDNALILSGGTVGTGSTAGAKILGSGKIVASSASYNPSSPSGTEIVGGTGGWQAVGGTVDADRIVISWATASGTSIKAEGTFPVLTAETGAIITQNLAVSHPLTIETNTTINLQGDFSTRKGSIILKRGTGPGTLKLADDTAFVKTGNSPMSNTKKIQPPPAASPNAAISGVAGSSDAMARSNEGVNGMQGYLAVIVGIAGTGGTVIPDDTSGSVTLSSQLAVTVTD